MLVGHTIPRLYTKPLRDVDNDPEATLGFEAIEFANNILKIELIDWQEWFLKHVLELNEDGSLRFRTALLELSRQNGKSFIMTILALYFMIVLNPGELVLGTAQNLETSEGTWDDALKLANSAPYTKRQLLPKNNGKVSRTNGNKYMQFGNGSRWKVATATRKGGRGKAAKLVLMDELREHQNFEAWEAISNTTLAQSDALVLGVSNAGDSKSIVLKQQRDKAIAKIDDPETTMAIFEWSTPDSYSIDDEEGWMYANPSCNKAPSNLTLGNLRSIRESATDIGWRVENLGQWVTASHAGPWDEGVWESNIDLDSKIDPDAPLVLAVDTSFNRSMSCIVAAGWSTTQPGKVHIEVIALREGNAWVADWIDARFEKLGPSHVVLQGKSSAGDLTEQFDKLRIPITPIIGGDVTASSGLFYDAVRDQHIVHIDQQPLTLAAESAQLNIVGSGRFMFDRRKSPVDIAPLVAASLAWYVLTGNAEPPKKRSAYENTGLMVV